MVDLFHDDGRPGSAQGRDEVGTSPLIVWTCRADGGVDAAGLGWSHYTGMRPARADLEGWLAVAHPDDREVVASFWGGPAPFDATACREATVRVRRGSDGTYGRLLVRAEPIESGDGGRRGGWIGTAVEVDDATADDPGLNLVRSERLASLGTLAACLAHELGNTLGAILASAEVARISLPADAPPDLATSLDVVTTQADRASRVLRELLRFARREPGDFAPHDVNAVVRGTAGFLGSFASHPNLDVRLELAEPAPVARLDPTQIELLLLNLLANAAQSTDRCVRAVVSTRVVPGDSPRVEIRVDDDGPGIPAAARPRIFEPFFTTRRDAGGTGLGLGIVRRVVEAHRGTIDVDCPAGGGTSFAITLPAAEG